MNDNDVAILNKTRKDLFDRIDKSDLKQSELCDGFSRHTLWRFEKGGDIRLSNFLTVINRLGYKLLIITK